MEPPLVQILVSVAITMVRSHRSEARKGSNTMLISIRLVGPKGDGSTVQKVRIFACKKTESPERERS